MNIEKKILFTDLDDTLLTTEKSITLKTRTAIDDAISRGHYFVVATGRPIKSAIAVAEQFSFIAPGFYIISYNGGLIYDCHAKQILFKATLPFPYLRTLFDEAAARGLHYHTYADDTVIADRLTPELTYYCSSRAMMPYLIVDNILDYLKEEPVKTIIMDLENKDKLLSYRAHMAAWEVGKVNSVFSASSMLEYCPLEATKGLAVQFLCNYLNIPIEHSIAAGDENNDISMLDTAGVGVAMLNASDAVKAHANYTTKHDNNHDGIAEVIEAFMP